jgi:hypothetical protein
LNSADKAEFGRSDPTRYDISTQARASSGYRARASVKAASICWLMFTEVPERAFILRQRASVSLAAIYWSVTAALWRVALMPSIRKPATLRVRSRSILAVIPVPPSGRSYSGMEPTEVTLTHSISPMASTSSPMASTSRKMAVWCYTGRYCDPGHSRRYSDPRRSPAVRNRPRRTRPARLAQEAEGYRRVVLFSVRSKPRANVPGFFSVRLLPWCGNFFSTSGFCLRG